MKFEGIYPPVITPHKEDLSIDRDGFVVMVEHLIASGVHGIIVGGTTGEYYAQTKEERTQLMRLAKNTIKGRLPLIVGVGAIRTEDCVEFGLLAKENGADAILVNAPLLCLSDPARAGVPRASRSTGRSTCRSCFTTTRAAPAPLMDAEFFDRVGRSANFRAIKESSGDINQLHMLARDYPSHHAAVRHGRPGARVLRLGRARLGLRRRQLPAEGAHRAL